ncbi:hypothetical protein SLEP1_g3975 [Rubroshorea leprosula]|uniref:Uncharacterized protein n=1 Tax=Rubroshorea leprosula TaxID=152421 RepID=A0AAV5HM74_9ROSI|nr:hypothetical protein SLEP1_g3975 [Rubroshorea leprosula]
MGERHGIGECLGAEGMPETEDRNAHSDRMNQRSKEGGKGGCIRCTAQTGKARVFTGEKREDDTRYGQAGAVREGLAPRGVTVEKGRSYADVVRGLNDKVESNGIDGKQLEGVESIKQGVASYFENLLKEEDWTRLRLDGIHFNQISESENILLTAPFSEEEVRKEIWGSDGSKAPGPDGCNLGFFRNMWEVIKPVVLAFVNEFHSKG